jgi:hypothetical protein
MNKRRILEDWEIENFIKDCKSGYSLREMGRRYHCGELAVIRFAIEFHADNPKWGMKLSKVKYVVSQWDKLPIEKLAKYMCYGSLYYLQSLFQLTKKVTKRKGKYVSIDDIDNIQDEGRTPAPILLCRHFNEACFRAQMEGRVLSFEEEKAIFGK